MFYLFIFLILICLSLSLFVLLSYKKINFIYFFTNIIFSEFKRLKDIWHEDIVFSTWDGFWACLDFIAPFGSLIGGLLILHFIFFRYIIHRDVFIFLFLKFFFFPTFVIYIFYIYGFNDFKSYNFIILIFIYALYFFYVFILLPREIRYYEKIRIDLYLKEEIGEPSYQDQTLKAIFERLSNKIKKKWLYVRQMSWKDIFFEIFVFKILMHLNDLSFLVVVVAFNDAFITRYYPNLRRKVGEIEEIEGIKIELDPTEYPMWDNFIENTALVLLGIILVSFVFVHYREKYKEKK